MQSCLFSFNHHEWRNFQIDPRKWCCWTNKININDKRFLENWWKLLENLSRLPANIIILYYPCIEALHFLWSLAQMLSKQGNFHKKHPETWQNQTCQNASVGRLLHCCVLLSTDVGLRNRPFTNINQGADLSGSISIFTLWSFSVISSVEIVELESIWKDPRNKITSASLIFLRDGHLCVASNKRFLDCARASSVTCGSVGWGSLFVGIRLWYLAKYHLHPAQALAWYFLFFRHV